MVANEGRGGGTWLPFLAGVVAGAGVATLARAARRALAPRGLDARLIRRLAADPEVPPTVFVPGILGSELVGPDGPHWLNLGNAIGYYDLALPLALPHLESRDALKPAGLLGVDAVLPRLFGFTEYADVMGLLESAGFRRDRAPDEPGPTHHVYTYDWRRDLVESARGLGQALEELAIQRGDPDLRVNVIAHSMGGLVARYYLRFGDAGPGGPVTWAGARRLQHLVLVATPNAGGVSALEALLNGTRVGFSSTTLASSVTERMPAVYQLLPPAGVPGLIDARGDAVEADLHDPASWERFGWGCFATQPKRRRAERLAGDAEQRQAFVRAALAGAREFHEALCRPPESPCPAKVVLLGGDCLPTLGRAVVAERPGEPPRFEPETREHVHMMLEAGDGRVTRASALASHLPGGEERDTGGLPEVSHAFFGAADHHGIYREPTFQSLILRVLLRPVRRAGPDLLAASGAPTSELGT
jgi:pimeloyl-ACP methyl ester carboxylesterase